MLSIREEEPSDLDAIRQVERAAFGQPTETELVDRLRTEGDLAVSLVAIDGDELVGHLALSRMEAPFRALGLGPVAVTPARQRTGIGGQLIERSIAWAKKERCEAIFVLGEPAYYGRFGFDVQAARGFASPYAGPYLMVLPLAGALPATTGAIEYAPAFATLP